MGALDGESVGVASTALIEPKASVLTASTIEELPLSSIVSFRADRKSPPSPAETTEVNADDSCEKSVMAAPPEVDSAATSACAVAMIEKLTVAPAAATRLPCVKRLDDAEITTSCTVVRSIPVTLHMASTVALATADCSSLLIVVRSSPSNAIAELMTTIAGVGAMVGITVVGESVSPGSVGWKVEGSVEGAAVLGAREDGASVGLRVGLTVGDLEGATDGSIDGAAEGLIEGVALGATLGTTVGNLVGEMVGPTGANVGTTLGAIEGATEGATEGPTVGVTLGAAVGAFDGVAVGVTEGTTVGATEGDTVGVTDGATLGRALGVAVGVMLGSAVGATVGSTLGVTVGALLGCLETEAGESVGA